MLTIFAFLANSFGGVQFAGISWAAEPSSGLTSVGPEKTGSPAPLKEMDAGTFMLPNELGYVQDSAKVEGSAKTVIHIQDAHCNYYAQKRIAEIVGYLSDEYGIRVVNCEGGSGDYDLGMFTGIPETDIRQKVSDFFVGEGVVNAAEFYAVNNPGKAKLWGVEDPGLYLKNLKVYKESLVYKAEAEKDIKTLSAILDDLKKRIYSAELLDFDSCYARYKDEKMSFREYVSYLVTVAQKRAIDIRSFPDIYLLAQTLDEEQKIDFRKANNEKDEVVEKLKKLLSRNELKELVAKAADVKLGRMSQGGFYAYLAKKCRSAKLDLGGYKDLSKYIIYISLYSAIDKTKIAAGMAALEDAIRDSLYGNDTQRELGTLSKYLVLEKNMFNISITRDDYNYYLKNRSGFDVANFTRFIEKNAPLYGISAGPGADIGMLDTYREKMEVFYECSLERDAAFVRSTKFTDDTRPASIIITGGFHTENLRELFTKEKVSYVSIIPKFTSPPGYKSPYLARLAGQRTALETVVDNVIPAVLNLAVVNILSKELAIEVIGEAAYRRTELEVRIMTALARGQRFIFSINKSAYPEDYRNKPEDKVVVFNNGGGSAVPSSETVSAGQPGFERLAAAANATLARIDRNVFEVSYTPVAPAVPPAAQEAAVAVVPAAAVPAAAEEAAVAALKEVPVYKEASVHARGMASMLRPAPTYLLSPRISDTGEKEQFENNRLAEQLFGNYVHPRNYFANGRDWEKDKQELTALLENMMPDFVRDAEATPLTRMAIRLVSDENGARIKDMKGIIKEILTRKYGMTDIKAEDMIEKKIKFVPISIEGVVSVNASLDLLVDMGLMELNRYTQDDIPRSEMPPELAQKVVMLLKSSITDASFDEIMKLVKTTDNIEGILNTIFRCSVVLRIRPVDWKSLDEWKKANEALLRSA
jgi:hypothetical protein